MPIQPLSINQYQTVPEFEDVTQVDDSIDKKAKKSLKYAAVACGCCIVTTLVTLLSVRVSISIMLPPLTVYQTSLYGYGAKQKEQGGDRLRQLDSADMLARGFNVGLLAFGNMECTKLLKVIDEGKNIIQGQGFSEDKCEPPHPSEAARVTVDTSTTYQEILGFGGAFTEAAAINFYKLPADVQKQVVTMYFGQDGIGYTLGRVPINSCDFSEQSYSFDEIAGDYDLEYFDAEVTHDEAVLMPLLRLALEASPLPLRLLASPWSPPKWMKAPMKDGRQYMNGSAVPNGLLDDPRVRRSWALYISKWIQAYESKGVPIWAVTPQNEPEFPAPWEACAWEAAAEREWIDGYLGPTLRRDHPEKLILAFDHNKDGLLRWAEAMLGADSSSAFAQGPSEFVDGMAFHWYGYNDDRMVDGTFGYNNVNLTHHLMRASSSSSSSSSSYSSPRAAPGSSPSAAPSAAPSRRSSSSSSGSKASSPRPKVLLASEGCSCPGVKQDNWLRAERLAHDVLFDLNNFAQGWIDWNLLVDWQGGPNHLNNFCDAPLVAAKDFSLVHAQPKYFFMGHISKFVPPGSVRVFSNIVGNFAHASGLDPNIRAGVELGAFSCERSPRQQWKLNGDKALELRALADDSEATDGYQARLCAAPGNTNRPYLHVVVCNAKPVEGYAQPLRLTRLSSSGLWLDEVSGRCLGLAGGVNEPGALLELQPCAGSGSPAKAQQQLVFDVESGEVRLGGGGGRPQLCLTVGWPMLTGAAFLDTHKRTVVVLLNEADAETKVVISDSVKGDSWLGMSPKSIMTVVY